MPDELAWETTATGIDYTCPGFSVRRDEVRLPDGTPDSFHYVDEPPSVVVLPFTPDAEVVLIEEWRQAVGRVSRGFPAGGAEPDDDDLGATARRELTEETGYRAGGVEHLLTVEPANGIADSRFHYYVARDCRPGGERDLDENESIRVTTADWDRLREQVLSGDLRDGRTALGVLYYDAAG